MRMSVPIAEADPTGVETLPWPFEGPPLDIWIRKRGRASTALFGKLHYSATRILRKPYIHTQMIEGREPTYGETNEIGQKEVPFSINRSRTTRAREARHI